MQMQSVKRHRRLFLLGAILLSFLLAIFIVILVLALTVFRAKEPQTRLLSASIDGIAPRISFPVVRVELNVSFDLKILVDNRNHASFKHGSGKSELFYDGDRVGEAEIFPGEIKAMDSSVCRCRLTVDADEIASRMESLIRDVASGEIVMETRTTIPGKICFLRIFRKHVVVVSECQFAIGIPDMEIRKQDCKRETKF